jgi:beta-lactam-binding protein with PASTA domain
MVFMPDLIAPAGSVYGQITTREKATAACEAIGLIPVFVAETKSGRLPGEVWYQSVAPGKEIFENTTVTLKYNPVTTTIPVPDFAGKSRDQIVAEGYLKLLTITFQTADEPDAGMPGIVQSQSIRAGEVVAVGTAITLVVSPEAEPTPVVTEAPSPTPTAPAEPSPTPPES